MSNQAEQVFFSPSAKYMPVIDYFKEGESFAVYSNKLRSELVEEYPDGIITTWEDAGRMIDERATTAPKEIDKDRFWYLLEVLPPVRWNRGDWAETFRVSECINGTVYTACVRIGERYFELQQPIRVTHAELVELCKAVMS